MNIVSLFSFGLALLAFADAMVRRADLFSPGRLFLMVWAVAIGLTEMKLSAFQHAWTSYAWFVLISGLAAFLLGVFAVNVMMTQSGTVSLNRMRASFRQGDSIQSRRYLAVTSGIFAAYGAAYCAEVALAGTVPLLSQAPDRARMEFGIAGLHLIVNAAPVVLILCSEYFIFPMKSRRFKFPVLVMFIVTFFSYALLLQRFNFILWGIVTLVLMYYTGTFLRPRNVLIGMGVLASLLWYLQNIRLGRYVANYIHVVSRMRYSESYAVFTEPYMYIVMNLENLARAVEKIPSHTYGYYTFDPFFALSGLKHWLASYFSLIERPFLVSGYNTFPYLWPYVRDFGIPGAIVISFILGSAIAALYYSFRGNRSPVLLLLYAVSASFIILSFFTNILTMLNTVFAIALLMGANVSFLKPSPSRNEA